MKTVLPVLFSGLLMVLISCSGRGGTGERGATMSVNKAGTEHEQIPEFLAVCASADSSNINALIHPVHGAWLITSGGAMPSMQHIREVPPAAKQKGIQLKDVIHGELPAVDCNSPSLWTKQGCFAHEENRFLDEKIWDYCSLTENDKWKIIELAKTIRWTVINTSEGRYYFSLIDNRWYLAFMDIRVPCSA